MDGAFGLVLNKNKILLVKRRDYPIWVMPGGGVDKNETPEKAVIREVFEESGFKVKIAKKIAEYLVNSERIVHFYKCEIISGKATTSPESNNIDFFDLTNLPEPINPLTSCYIEDYKKNNKIVIKKPNPKISNNIIREYIIKRPITAIRYLLTKVGVRINI